MTPIDALSELVSAIPDPEIPVLTIADLGIFRGVCQRADGTIEVQITPTYSGCPAMIAIRDMIESALFSEGVSQFEVVNVMSPAWTTDWITAEGRVKMKAYGIAPPVEKSKSTIKSTIKSTTQEIKFVQGLFQTPVVACPRCDSESTQRISAFGSTACQEQWRCADCHEPFDHFKCH